MKYLIMHYGSQADMDALTGKGSEAWTPEQVTAMHEFMATWVNDLVESGEFVDAKGLAAPVHTRRVGTENGKPVVTDGPYAETTEVLLGYTLVDCVSLDRATEIVARLADTPAPEHARNRGYVDIRPVVDGMADLL